MGNTEQEQAEAMKRYIREVFVPEYAKNFNKGLFTADIKFYGKIHFDRSRSDNELNMHCHLIVSRKDQTNKKKLSPLTNHKNTKKGTVTGGFDSVNLFQQAKQGFDKLFSYERQQFESFDYHNMMNNGSIYEQLKKQEQYFQLIEKEIEVNQDSNQENLLFPNFEHEEASNQTLNTNIHIVTKKENKISVNLPFNYKNKQLSDLPISFATSITKFPQPNTEEQKPKHRKKRKRRLQLILCMNENNTAFLDCSQYTKKKKTSNHNNQLIHTLKNEYSITRIFNPKISYICNILNKDEQHK